MQSLSNSETKRDELINQKFWKAHEARFETDGYLFRDFVVFRGGFFRVFHPGFVAFVASVASVAFVAFVAGAFEALPFFTYLSKYLSIYPSIHPSIHLSIYNLSIYPSIHL